MGRLSAYQYAEVRVRDVNCLILRRLLSVLSTSANGVTCQEYHSVITRTKNDCLWRV